MKGKVVWITGASSGIGLALAKAYAQKGACLIVSARRSGLLEEFQNQLPNPKDCCVLPLDLRNHEQASQWVRQALDFKGHIDILINNAGNNIPEHFTKVKTKNMELLLWNILTERET